jgi:hypothetical protein
MTGGTPFGLTVGEVPCILPLLVRPWHTAVVRH